MVMATQVSEPTGTRRDGNELLDPKNSRRVSGLAYLDHAHAVHACFGFMF